MMALTPVSLNSVAAIGALVEGQFDRPIMREIHRAPACIAEKFAGGTGAGSGLGKIDGGAPFVAEMKFPVGIEQ